MNSKLFAICASLVAVVLGGNANATDLVRQGVNPAAIAAGDGGGFSYGAGQHIANSFNIAGGGTINEVTWYGGSYWNQPFTQFNVTFFADSAGLPGTLLTTTTLTPTATVAGPNDGYGQSLYEFTASIPSFTAAAGTTYWLSISDNSSSGDFVWTPGIGPVDEAFEFSSSGPWRNDNLAGQPYRGSEAFTLSSVAGVPEAGTWAMMIIGLGLVGLSLRQRKAAVAA